ncbi:macro domain-containing protein [Candidatus Parcubacteria bacterium]|nr:macro domain-containing protein [Candidatus Parcubacteria bacterium]
MNKSKTTPKTYLVKGNILDFDGDAIICPCFTDPTYCKESKLLRTLFELAGKDLEKELSSVGFCEVGNAVITKGYGLKVRNIIFLPYKEKESPDDAIDFIFLHKSFRNAFSLASLYGLKTIAMKPTPIEYKKQGRLYRFLVKLGLEKEERFLQPHEVVDIATGILDECKGKINELVIYK